MQRIAQTALAAWGLADADVALIAQRENIVFRVTQGSGRYALRLHRPGYQSPRMIASELAWMQYLGSQGLRVPAPVPSQDGSLLREVDGYQVDVLTWLDGVPLGATGAPLQITNRCAVFARLGGVMAQIHQASDAWDRPATFERPSWDIEGLLGETPLWDRFWDNPDLTAEQRTNVLRARDGLRRDLEQHAVDEGLIHADLLRENVMIDGQSIGVIDFDDCGFGFRLFDVVTTLFKNRAERDYPELEASFLRGYREVRALDTQLLPQFMLIRALSYLGWIITRLDEPGSDVRRVRFVPEALPLVDEYLSAVAVR